MLMDWTWLASRSVWVAGSLLVALALFLLARNRTTIRGSTRQLTVVGFLLVGGAALIVPSVARLVGSAAQLAGFGSPAFAAPSATVGLLRLVLPSITDDAIPGIKVRIWYPRGADDPTNGPGVLDCEQALTVARLKESPTSRPLLIYSHFVADGSPDTSSMTAATLAEHGYVVMGVGDIDADSPPWIDPLGQYSAPLEWKFGSTADYARTLQQAARKADLQARKMLKALDRFEACALAPASGWRGRLNTEKVGAFGFSVMGATAAEAAILDNRIAVAVNQDGWLVGRALAGQLTAPYLLLQSDYSPPKSDVLKSPDDSVRYFWSLTAHDLKEEARLISRDGSEGYLVRGIPHDAYSDAFLLRRFWKFWLFAEPVATKRKINDAIVSFFDKHLKEGQPTLPPPDLKDGQLVKLGDDEWRAKIAAGVEALREGAN